MSVTEQMISIYPLGDKVVIRQQEADTTTPGGIVLPDSAKKRPKRGIIVACGSDANKVLSKGDEIIYSQYAGTEIELDGETLVILSGDDILARL